MTLLSDYCPYDLITTPETLDLQGKYVASTFGQLYMVRPKRKTTKRATLFLHGVGSSWTFWTPLLQEAKKQGVNVGDTVFFDLPGFGMSQNELDHLQSKAVGNELLRIVQEHGWDEVVVVGHSMGGFLTLEIAARQDPRVKGVAVISGTYLSIIQSVDHPVRTFVRRPYMAVAYLFMVLTAKLGRFTMWLSGRIKDRRLFTLALAGTFAHPKLVKKSVRDEIAANIRPRAFVLAAQNGKSYDPIKEWNKITVPFAALFGSTDQLIPASDAAQLQAELQHMHVTRFEDTGHYAQVEWPKQTLAWLTAALPFE